MPHLLTKTLFATFGLAAGVGISSLQDPQGCPAPVSATAKRVLGDLTGAKIEKETEHEITTYEIVVKGKDGVASVNVAESGELIASERQVAEASLPAAVRAAFAKKHPGAKLVRAEMVEKHSFELLFEQDGKQHGVEILPSGLVQVVGEEEEEEENEKPGEKPAEKKEGKEK